VRAIELKRGETSRDETSRDGGNCPSSPRRADGHETNS